MNYIGTSINSSATMVGKLDVDYTEDLRGRAFKFDATGNLTMAKADTDVVIGVAILNNDPEKFKKGEDLHVQMKDIGHVRVGANVKAGDELMVDATGRFVKATGGKRAFAVALEAAGAEDEYVRAIVGRCSTAGA